MATVERTRTQGQGPSPWQRNPRQSLHGQGGYDNRRTRSRLLRLQIPHESRDEGQAAGQPPELPSVGDRVSGPLIGPLPRVGVPSCVRIEDSKLLDVYDAVRCWQWQKRPSPIQRRGRNQGSLSTWILHDILSRSDPGLQDGSRPGLFGERVLFKTLEIGKKCRG